MRVKCFYILFLVLLVSNVFAEEGLLYIQDAVCDKDGSLSLTFRSYSTNKLYTEDIDIRAEYIGEEVIRKPEFDVIGKWDYEYIREKGEASIISEEVVFNLTGEYMVTVNYLDNNEPYIYEYKIKCPGFYFSCKLISVNIDYCKNINDERFEASVKIYGLGDVTKENLSLDKNVDFIVHAEKDYEDIKGKFADMGGLPKIANIENPYYGQYYFNISWVNKIEKFVTKIVGINYIEGGCVNYPNISLYSYRECEDIEIEEKEEPNQSIITSQIVKETKQEILEELERDVNTSKRSKLPLFILLAIFVLCVVGVSYIILKRNFNKEPSL